MKHWAIYNRERVDTIGASRSIRCYPALESCLPKEKLPLKKLRICIVTQDFVGPVKNGGVGTAYTYAARALAMYGYDVTVLYSVRYCSENSLDYWTDVYRRYNINFVPVPEPEVPAAKGPSSSTMRVNYTVYEWMKKHSDTFDIIHASEWNANVYMCMQAKKLGLHFQNTQFVIKCSSPTLWNHIGNSEPITDFRTLILMHIERRCVEMADYVICGSEYLLNWMEDQGYDIPYTKTFVQPNIFPFEDVETRILDSVDKVTELVFFGRLEPRKGICIFVDALLQMADSEKYKDFDWPKITFMGKFRPNFDAKKLIRKLESKNGITVSLQTEFNQIKALDYLFAGDGKVAVMPSLMDNSPFGVYECLAKNIAFITSSAGGGKELVTKADWDEILFDPTPVSLANRLDRILKDGLKKPRPSFDFKKNIDDWMQWHLWAATQQTNASKENDSSPSPLVSVCVAHHNRGDLLCNAIESIMAQDYHNIEVIVVDDGSTCPDSMKVLENLKHEKHRFPLRVIRQPNRYLGAVRNTGAANSKGAFLLFMDDDNEAKKNEVSTFVEVAIRSKSEILTCLSDTFNGKRPHKSKMQSRRIVFSGQNLAMGLVSNPYGDSNCFVRKDAFEKLGGFSEHYKVGRDDVEFFSRAILSGMQVNLIPEALYCYRINEVRMRQGQYSIFSGLVRVSEPFTQGIHPDIANIIRYAQGLSFKHGPWKKKALSNGDNSNKIVRVELNLTAAVKEKVRRILNRFPLLYRPAKWIYTRFF